jgi:hypothetical protein
MTRLATEHTQVVLLAALLFSRKELSIGAKEFGMGFRWLGGPLGGRDGRGSDSGGCGLESTGVVAG